MIKDIELIYRLNEDWKPGRIKIKKAGGQTNRNYIVQTGKKRYFVRLPWEADVIDRKIEGKNILALSRCQQLREILPKHYIYILDKKNILDPKSRQVFDLPDGTMLAEYIDGKLFTLYLLKNKEYQKKLARMFYIFHKSQVNFANKYSVFRDELARYRVAVEKRGITKFVKRKTALNLKKIEVRAERKIPVLKKGVPTHNDFIFQNFLTGKNGKIYLLDFEYAGMNIKGGFLYDFAFLFADNLFRKPAITEELFEQFLRVADGIYGKRLDREQVYWLAFAVPVMQVWWGLLRYSDVKTKKEKEYFKDYIMKRVDWLNKKGVKES